jgi:hypothetical protein
VDNLWTEPVDNPVDKTCYKKAKTAQETRSDPGQGVGSLNPFQCLKSVLNYHTVYLHNPSRSDEPLTGPSKRNYPTVWSAIAFT